ncbi:hypothetical protein LTR27_008124 [Elasticomyces elasticus]|nr:hypothetical protein LTR27_008124 [Elasticomyces elasticus]
MADSQDERIDYSIVNPGAKWRMLRHQWRYALWCLWISSGVVMQGFDIVAGGQLAALPTFQKQFGVLRPDGSYLIPAHVLSAWNSIAPATEIVATFIFVPLLEKYGRKPQVLAAMLISTAGVLLQQLAKEWTMHLAGRAVNGVAIGMMFTISPLWIGETCRPELRGLFLCFFNTSIVFGQLSIVAVSRGTSTMDTKWQWWAPVVAMYFFPFILTVVWPWFPESPYWLIRQGRVEQGKKSLKRMYGFDDEDFYSGELRRIETEIHLSNQVVGTGGIDSKRPIVDFSAELQCFRGLNRKRTLTAIFAASGQQMIGATFVIGYATYFFDLIGIKDYFDASIVLYVVMLLASMAAFPLTEILGRRVMIIWPQFVLCGMLLLIGIMGCVPDQKKAGWGIVVFIYFWAIIYQLSIGATGFVLASEIATQRLRGVTQGLITITNSLWGLIMQFTVPYMINPDAGRMGGKIGFVFLGLGLCAAVGGYFLYPETKGISFEQLDQLYAAKVPPRHFAKAAREGIHMETGDLHVEKSTISAKE